MRIIIDTDTNTIIVPNTYYAKIDEKNEVLEKHGGAKSPKIDYTQYIKDAFQKAINNPFKRQEDVAKKRK